MPFDLKRNQWLLWTGLLGGMFLLFLAALFTLFFLNLKNETDAEYAAFGEKLAVVEIRGVILDPRETVKELKRFAEDKSIKAILLHLNSPGGGAAASQEIYQTVKDLRDSKKKRVFAIVETVGASGAYYIAAGTERIYANPASIVGSVGVIAQWVNYGELMKWAKLKDVTLKAGELKDAGSPAREMTPEERAYLQSIIDDMHGQFIAAVADGRKMKIEELRPLASGRVWTGQQALGLKLVDKLATFDQAVHEIAQEVGIKGEPKIVRPRREKTTVLDAFFGDASQWIPTRTQMMQQNPDFYYLWK